MRRKRSNLLDGRAAGVAALAIFFLPLLSLVFGYRLLVFRDAFITHFPIARLAAALERAGTVPFLNFRASNVEPLLSNPNTVVLYPMHLLFRIFSPAVAFNVHLLFHVAWAFFGAAYLCRRLGAGGAAHWVGGATYAFSGPYLSYASAFMNAGAAAAWAPWAIACAVRLANIDRSSRSELRERREPGIGDGGAEVAEPFEGERRGSRRGKSPRRDERAARHDAQAPGAEEVRVVRGSKRSSASGASRAAAVALGIALGLQLLAGEPAISAWTLVACALPFVARFFRRGAPRPAGAIVPGLAGGLLALAIAAPLLLATRAALPWSFRGEHLFSRDQFNAARNVPLRLVENFLPLVFGSPRPIVSGTFWAYAPFDSMQPYLYSLNFGLASLLLIGAALAIPAYRRSRTVLVVAAATVLSFLLTFGFGTPLFEILYAIAPLRRFRYPIKFALPAVLGISILAALAFRAVAAARERFRGSARAAAAIGSALVVVGAMVTFAPQLLERIAAPSLRTLRFGPDQVMPGIAASILRDALWGGAAMALAALALTRFSGAARGTGLLSAVLATLLPAGWPLFVSVPSAPYLAVPALAGSVRDSGRAWVGNLPEFAVAKLGTKHTFERDDIGELILAGRRELWPLTGIPDGVSYAYDKDPDGSYGFLDRVFFEAVGVKTSEERSRLLSAASVRFAITPDGESPPGFVPRFRAEIDGRPVLVSETPRPVPVVRAAGRVFRRQTLSGAVDLIASSGFDPASDAVLRGPDGGPAARIAARMYEIVQRGNGFSARIASGGTVAVFAATYFRSWKAAVDGTPAPVEIANGSFCGVRVPPGDHRVELFYDEGPFRTGAALGLAAAALAILTTIVPRRSRPVPEG